MTADMAEPRQLSMLDGRQQELLTMAICKVSKLDENKVITTMVIRPLDDRT